MTEETLQTQEPNTGSVEDSVYNTDDNKSDATEATDAPTGETTEATETVEAPSLDISKVDLKDLNLDEAGVKAAAEFFESNNFTTEQASAGAEFFKGILKSIEDAQVEAYKTQKQSAEEALKQEWRDQYDANLAAADNFVNRVAGDGANDLWAALQEPGIAANHPVVIKFLMNASKLIGEDAIDNEVGKKAIVEPTSSIEDRLYKTI